MTTGVEQLQPEKDQYRLATCMVSAMDVTPFVTKAYHPKALIQLVFFKCYSRATASRPSHLAGLRPALTRSRGKPKSIHSTRSDTSSSTQNYEVPISSPTQSGNQSEKSYGFRIYSSYHTSSTLIFLAEADRLEAGGLNLVINI